ncbi:HEAT repeat domain-containing protein [Kitasatospora sp. NPDC056731]|uniref:HEAT repeat domain-containing protein n=1 Tax=Kitasatospora sp. NPDC056731 TaxID=3155422 RepID=UPI0034412616
MDLAHALDGLDAHPWASVSHAYGPAEDLPGLLRALAAGGEQADEALAELYSCILHQGSVYTASADAVPYLARIAAAGCGTVEVLGLLGGLAESEGEWDGERGDGGEGPPAPVRAAVVGQLPLLLPLLADGSAGVRQAAAWAVGQTRAVEPALSALRRRWASETDPIVRGELLTALGRLDRSGAAAEAGPLLGEDTPAPLRLAAVLAGLDAGEPWTGAHHAAVLALLPADPVAVDRYDLDRREPLRVITEELLLRETPADRDAAYALLDRALRDERPEVRAEAVWAADHACQLSRSAPRRLLPALAQLVADPDVVHLLGNLGPAAAEAAPGLAARAAQAEDGPADEALAALVLVAPRTAAPLLARALGRRPRALEAAAGQRAPADAPFPFDPELLAAVRARLTAEQLGGNEHHQLFRLVRQWGRAAAPALPELCAVLPHRPEAAAAVAAVAVDGPAAERDRAAAALREVPGSVAAARALYDLTGDPEALLGALADRLAAGPYAVAEAARAAADLGPGALPLAPALRAALSAGGVPDTSPVLEADLAVADALWRITGDAAEVVPILDGVLRRADDGAWFDRTAVRAARVAALLGPAARPLTARLDGLLADRVKAPAAVLALLAVADGAALDRGRLVEAALRAAETGSDLRGAGEALAALGATALDDGQRRRLADVAGRDRRIVGGSFAGAGIRDDEALRALLAAVAGG